MTESMTRRGGNLPAETTGFVGRRRELAELTGLCRRPGPVTVTGVGGVGKTRLALRAARDLAAEFPDGTWLVELAGLRDGALLGHAVGRTLRIPDQTARPRLDVIADHLAGTRLLLVLDTCEHLTESCAPLVRALLDAAPGVRVLATGRRPLGLDDERTLTLNPLPAAPASASAVRSDAVTLFEQRAAARVPGFAVTERNLDTVAGVCRRLEGIPLAIELAAGQLPELSLDQLAARLDDRFQVLVDDGRDEPSRHRALRTTVGWSHELCAPRERLLWARLSVFPDDFDLEAAERVCGDDVLPMNAVPQLVEGLVGKSVLARSDDAAPGGATRYRMLDTLRQYGAEWLRELGEQDLMARRHRDWYLRLAEWGEQHWFGSVQTEVFRRLYKDHVNIGAALDHCLTAPGQARTGLHMAASLWFYWVGCGFLDEGRYWLDRALALDTEPSGTRAKALWVNGYVAIKQGDSAGAVAHLEESQAEAQRTDDRTALANAVHRLGCVALVNDEHALAEVLFKETLAQYEALGELNASVIMARVEFAMNTAFQGDLEAAAAMCEQVHAVCEEHNEQWVRAYALYVMAFAALTGGRLDEAERLTRASMRISHTFHDLVCTVLSIELLALVRVMGGDGRDAAALQGAAGRIWRTVGLPLFGSAYFNAPHGQCETHAREALGDREYEAFHRAASRLGLDEAVAFALGDRPRPDPSEPSAPPRPPAKPSGAVRR
ncbi:ATP-binding protein [Actinomadura rugatobispora]|uniref:ATP-binding protein n=1 Tax=Actinomadura rugatobispora TaxID=1994 RepID=A0ABW0ZWS5_9ACTN|nr:hypothetical protein GCM10010200_077690 [Actinomadura rugatobispora]